MSQEDEQIKELQTQLGITKAQLAGSRALVAYLKEAAANAKDEADRLAGIGIECGCGEALCTADADNLRDALRQIRRLKAERDAVFMMVNVYNKHNSRLLSAGNRLQNLAGKLVTNETVTSEEYDAAIEAWLNAKHPKASTL